MAKTREEAEALRKEWAYSSAMLARSDSINAQYEEIALRYPWLLEKTADTAAVMSELDAMARSAGVQVDRIRPVENGQGRYELSLKGSWSAVMKFLREAEGDAGFFRFPQISFDRQDPSGELVVSAQAEKIDLK